MYGKVKLGLTVRWRKIRVGLIINFGTNYAREKIRFIRHCRTRSCFGVLVL